MLAFLTPSATGLKLSLEVLPAIKLCLMALTAARNPGYNAAGDQERNAKRHSPHGPFGSR